MTCVPADKTGDEGSENSTSEGGWIEDLVVPLNISNFFSLFFLWFFMCKFFNTFLNNFFGGFFLSLNFHIKNSKKIS